MSAKSYRMRFAVFILALAVRIAAIELGGAQTTTFGDAADYMATARSVCEQQVYPVRGNLPFFRAPGLPFFVAVVTACEPSRLRAIKYGLAVADALTVVVIFLIAQIVGTSPWIAALLATFHPFFVASTTDVRTEPLFMLLLTAAIWLVLKGRPAWAGMAVGLSALVRPTGLVCIPLLALFGAARASGPPPPGSGPKARAARLLVAALLTLAPWTIRNYLRFHEPIAVNDAGGFNMWRGTHPELLAITKTQDRAAFDTASWNFETKTVAETVKVVEAKAKTPGARDREWTKLAWENVRRDPGQALEDTLYRAFLYWRPWIHGAEHGPKRVAISFVVVAGLYLLAILGMIKHPDRRLVWAAVIFFVALWLVHLPYITGVRIRTPLTDPLLIVFAAGVTAWRRRGRADGDSRSRSAAT
jgi:hypothetical protein